MRAGAVCLWSYRQFLRLRTGLRRIRWVAQFGGVPWVALAAGGERVHDRASVRVTAHASGGRLAAAFEGRRRSRAGPPAGLCNGGRGGVGLSAGGRCLWSRLSRIPRRCRRLREAGRSGGIKPHHCCWPAETPGLTPPARPAWLRPPTATRDPGQHPCGVNRVHFATHTWRQGTHTGW